MTNYDVVVVVVDDDDDLMNSYDSFVMMEENSVSMLLMMLLVLRPVMMIVVMLVRLLKNSNVDHSYHWNIVMEEVVNDVTSLNVLENDADDSSSNSLVDLLKELELVNHKYYHDDRTYDVDTEMY